MNNLRLGAYFVFMFIWFWQITNSAKQTQLRVHCKGSACGGMMGGFDVSCTVGWAVQPNSTIRIGTAYYSITGRASGPRNREPNPTLFLIFAIGGD